MKKLKIITVPDQKLRQISQPITNFDPKTKDFLNNLGVTLAQKDGTPGAGLAAIQVGIPHRVFFTYLPQDPHLPQKQWSPQNLILKPFINPQIIATSSKVTQGQSKSKPYLEGCLSIPNLYSPVSRFQWIKVSYQTYELNPDKPSTDIQLKQEIKKYADFPARVIQHEYDHLDGILFTDYLKGTSPANNFQPQGPAGPLYFDDGDQFIQVDQPLKLITW